MKTISCDSCSKKSCKRGGDCYGIKDMSIQKYSEPETYMLSNNASKLIDNGRAGTMNRLEEIIEFCTSNNYKKIGIAYCIGMDHMANEVSKLLKDNDFQITPVVCTAGGVKEKDIDPHKDNDTVSCNPAGQAEILNRGDVDFVIEMGLCLGHDVIFHKNLTVPHTVFIVKDRVLNHNPALALESHDDVNTRFIQNLDDSFYMKSPQWLADEILNNESLTIIDLREKPSFQKGHIPGSINIPLKKLPKRFGDEITEKDSTIVCICNGSVQSAYGIMFLYSKGYQKVYNLSGGFSRWTKEEREITPQDQNEDLIRRIS